MERWRQIVGFRYDVSNLGRVRNNKTGKLRRLYARGVTGYVVVDLWRDGAPKARYVHILVLEAFKGPAPIGTQGSHRNNRRNDNRLRNLLWESCASNNRRKRQHGTGRGEAVARVLNETTVRNIRRSALGLKALAAKYGTSPQTIWAVRTGKTWTHVWKN